MKFVLTIGTFLVVSAVLGLSFVLRLDSYFLGSSHSSEPTSLRYSLHGCEVNYKEGINDYFLGLKKVNGKYSIRFSFVTLRQCQSIQFLENETVTRVCVIGQNSTESCSDRGRYNDGRLTFDLGDLIRRRGGANNLIIVVEMPDFRDWVSFEEYDVKMRLGISLYVDEKPNLRVLFKPRTLMVERSRD